MTRAEREALIARTNENKARFDAALAAITPDISQELEQRALNVARERRCGAVVTDSIAGMELKLCCDPSLVISHYAIGDCDCLKAAVDALLQDGSIDPAEGKDSSRG